jgi:diaminopimelate decarboxylase
MTADLPRHAPLTQLEIVDDCLHVGGIPLPRLAQRVGATPFYAYDRGAITRQIAGLRRHLPQSVQLHYAIKANPMPALVQHVSALVDGLDVASAREMMVALDTGRDPATISFAGPAKQRDELSRAIAAGVVINIESEHELETTIESAHAIGSRAKVAVRVNPDFELKSSGMKMGGGPKQFGIDAERVPALLARIGSAAGLAFEGFHIFSGSQNLRADALVEAQRKTLELALRLSAAAPAPPRSVNIGGGFGIPYFPGEKPLDIAAVGASLGTILPGFQRQLPGTKVVLELGRYIVGGAGVYVCRVVDRKVSRGEVFLITDGGLHHHLAASGNFGQVIRKNYPVAVGTRIAGGPRELASVVGPLCTPLDLLASQMDLAKADVGDLIVVFQSGAYGRSASPLGFLSHPEPLEILV